MTVQFALDRSARFIRRAREAGVLRDVDTSDARTQRLMVRPFGLFFCGDCAYSDDKTGHLKRWFGHPNIHLVAMNGGALLMDPRSQVNRMTNFSSLAIGQVQQTFILKPEIDTFFLEAHFPCGVANMHGIPIEEQFWSLIRAKHAVKSMRAHNPYHVGLLFHVCVREDRRTYYFSSTEMRSFLMPKVDENRSSVSATA